MFCLAAVVEAHLAVVRAKGKVMAMDSEMASDSALKKQQDVILS